MSSETPLEDGRTAVYDDSGNLVLIKNADGTSFNPDTSIVGDLARQFFGRVSTAVNQAFAVQPSAPVASNSPALSAAAASSRNRLVLIALGVAAFLYLRRKGA